MDKIRYMSWRPITKKMSYREENHDKTPALFTSEQVLTKRDFSESLWTKFGPSP